METQLVSEQIRSEARRVAAAFGLQQFKREPDRTAYIFVGYLLDSVSIRYLINAKTQQWEWMAVEHGKKMRRGNWQGEHFCWFYFQDDALTAHVMEPNIPHVAALLASGLYRLGFDDEEVWRELNVSLTFHEKLELRVSLPREFWPKTWQTDDGPSD